MYRVQYLCPRQSPNWQNSKGLYADLQTASGWADVAKPRNGWARVIDPWGRVAYQA